MGRRLRAIFALGVLGLLCTLILWVDPADAASHRVSGELLAQAGERIDTYDVDITIEESGDLVVVERIAYDFGSSQRHGIFRDIPVRYDWEPDPDYERVLRLGGISVTSDSAPDDIEVTSEGAIERIRVGDEDVTVTGPHSYEITYRVEGAILSLDNYDELFWDVVDAGYWNAAIGSATAKVTAPVPIAEATCFGGPAGSSLPCSDMTTDGATALFRQDSFGPDTVFTIVVGLPAGTVTDPGPILDERWSVSKAFGASPPKVGFTGLLLLLGFGAVGALVWKHGRDRHFAEGDGVPASRVPLGGKEVGAVEYRPPDGLRPAQVGVLIDEVADPLDVTATIIDLAVRGFFVIEEVPKEGWFGKGDWRLIRRPETQETDLLEYERDLLHAMFRDGNDVLLSDLKDEFHADLAKAQRHLYEDAVSQGWFRRRPDKTRDLWLGIGIVVTVIAIAVLVLLAIFTKWALLGLPLVLTGVAVIALHRWMPHRTAKGTATLRRVLGFRRFVETAETDRMRFAEEENIFARYLPYAIVFGAVEKWAKAFEGLGAEQAAAQTGYWYRGVGPFEVYVFSRSIRSFSTVTSGTIVSKPSSSGSSGFGGGGFSGGGVGGGGGGSW